MSRVDSNARIGVEFTTNEGYQVIVNDNYVLNKDIYYSNLGIFTDEKEYSLLTTRFITDSDNSKEMRARRT